MAMGDTFFNSSPHFFSTGNEKQNRSPESPQWKNGKKKKRAIKREKMEDVIDSLVTHA